MQSSDTKISILIKYYKKILLMEYEIEKTDLLVLGSDKEKDYLEEILIEVKKAKKRMHKLIKYCESRRDEEYNLNFEYKGRYTRENVKRLYEMSRELKDMIIELKQSENIFEKARTEISYTRDISSSAEGAINKFDKILKYYSKNNIRYLRNTMVFRVG